MRNFLLANALYWLEEFHADGLRVDAVASMLYLDYSRAPGEWLPNRFGGREDLEPVSFLQELNAVVHAAHPGVVMIAEESTAWPGVSRPTEGGGLGFTLKWNMGWMHDTLDYVSHEPVHRRWHHDELTFSMVYAWDENFVLPLSHDEVVHGKQALLRKTPATSGSSSPRCARCTPTCGGTPASSSCSWAGRSGRARSGRRRLARLVRARLPAAPRRAAVRRRPQPRLPLGAGPLGVDFRPGFQWLVGDAREDNVLAYALLGGRRPRARLPRQLLAHRPAPLARAPARRRPVGARC